MNLEQIQEALRSEGLDGWLFYDFRKSNPIAYQILSISLDSFFSRRWFYFVPASGTPTALVSAVESHVLNSLPGEQRIFRTWQEMRSHLEALLPAGRRIAMEYSPMNAIPYMSRVDGGTMTPSIQSGPVGATDTRPATAGRGARARCPGS